PVQAGVAQVGPVAYAQVDPAVGANWNAQIPMKPDKAGGYLAGSVGPVGPVQQMIPATPFVPFGYAGERPQPTIQWR
ncbi:hypothetical protein LCGC14_2604670, partial [marine sediment metagenome]